MEIKRDDLNALKERFEDRKEVLSNVLIAIQELISEVSTEISELDSLIQKDVMNKIKKTIDPKYCTHVNKKINTHGNAETVTCDDCGLLLSFKQL